MSQPASRFQVGDVVACSIRPGSFRILRALYDDQAEEWCYRIAIPDPNGGIGSVRAFSERHLSKA